jgi:Scaffold protein Nfu/NifU N terminal
MNTTVGRIRNVWVVSDRTRRVEDRPLRAHCAYDRAVATASPSPTPNPDATKFTLDTTLPATFNVTSADAAVGNRFAEDVFAADGVASVFGVNDFVTVTRKPGADWEPIVAAVQAAAATHL